MKWTVIFLNLVVIFALVAVRQYAHGYHRVESESAYQSLVSRGLLDEAKAEDYARAHNGWHPKELLRQIGSPDGFVQVTFVIGLVACVFNTVAILLLNSMKRREIAEQDDGGQPSIDRAVSSDER